MATNHYLEFYLRGAKLNELFYWMQQACLVLKDSCFQNSARCLDDLIGLIDPGHHAAIESVRFEWQESWRSESHYEYLDQVADDVEHGGSTTPELACKKIVESDVDPLIDRLREILVSGSDTVTLTLFELGRIVDEGLRRRDVHQFLACVEPPDADVPQERLPLGDWQPGGARETPRIAECERAPGELGPGPAWIKSARRQWQEVPWTMPFPEQDFNAILEAVDAENRLATHGKIQRIVHGDVASFWLIGPGRPSIAWDRNTGTLSIGGAVIKFRSDAKNCEPILDAFQSAKWPSSVTIPPLDDGENPVADKLADTITQLNGRTREHGVVFGRHGGTTVCFKVVPTPQMISGASPAHL